MDNTLIDLLDGLDHRQSEGEAYAVTRDYFCDLGFRYVNIGIATLRDGQPLGLFSNMGTDWLTHYVDMGYHTCDVMFDYAMQSTNARLCDPQTNQTLDSRNKQLSDQMLAEVEGEGLVSSLILPRHSRISDHMVGFNLCTDMAREDTRHLCTAKAANISLGAAITQVALLEDVEGQAYGYNWLPYHTDKSLSLTQREAEVFRWLLEGLRNDRIAEKMGISTPTVNFHIQSAKKKLGAKTRDQAIGIALMQKLL